MYNVITVYCTRRVHCQWEAGEIKHNVFCASLWYYLYVIITLMSFFLQRAGPSVACPCFLCSDLLHCPPALYADGALIVVRSREWSCKEQPDFRKQRRGGRKSSGPESRFPLHHSCILLGKGVTPGE